MVKKYEEVFGKYIRTRGHYPLVRMARVAKGAPEVLVKVGKFGSGFTSIKKHFDYISRKGELHLEDQNGDPVLREDFQSLSEKWSPSKSPRRTRDSTNIILSMPKGTPKNKVLESARDFAFKTFEANHCYVLVLHEDQKNPHVHLCVKNLGDDGRRLHIPRGRTQEWRESFAQCLRHRGVEAEATSRHLRGVVRKSPKQSYYHVVKREGTKNTQMFAYQEKEAEREHKEETSLGHKVPNPWEIRIKERQEEITDAWKEFSDDCKASQDENSQEIAQDIRRFLSSFPPVETLREELKKDLRKKEFEKKYGKIYLSKEAELEL